MENEITIKNQLIKLFSAQKFAVLATHTNGQPYTTLVAFAETRDLNHLLFATTRATRKYAHISNDPRAAMLIDNRSNQVTDLGDAMAVTAKGEVIELQNDKRAESLTVYLQKHSYLKDFVTAPTTALLDLQVQHYTIVRQFQHVMELKIR